MVKRLTEDQISRMIDLIDHEGLEAFLPYVDQATADLKLGAAKRLVFKTYRQGFVAFAGLALMVMTFWDKFLSGVGSFLKWIIGS